MYDWIELKEIELLCIDNKEMWTFSLLPSIPFFFLLRYILLLHLHRLLLLLTHDTTRWLGNLSFFSPFFTSNPSLIPLPLDLSLLHSPPIYFFSRVHPHLGTSVQPTESPIVTSISHALTNRDALAYRYFNALHHIALPPTYRSYTFHLLQVTFIIQNCRNSTHISFRQKFTFISLSPSSIFHHHKVNCVPDESASMLGPNGEYACRHAHPASQRVD